MPAPSFILENQNDACQHSFGPGWARASALAAGLACSLVFAAPSAPTLQLPPSTYHAAKLGLNCAQERSVARAWNEQMLAAIRLDSPRPTVHARTLFHVSTAMYDAWAAYDPFAGAHLVDESTAAQEIGPTDRQTAVSYAAYRVLLSRFSVSPGAATSLAAFQACMQDLGLDPANNSTSGNSAIAIGNRIGAAIIAHGLQDGSNQQGSYQGTFVPVNTPMPVASPGTGGVANINSWQPLIPPGAAGAQSFLTPHWRDVVPFAMTRSGADVPYADPGPPALIGGVGDTQVRADIVEVIRNSSQLDPADSAMVNASPRVRGNNPLGTNSGSGHAVNPMTGLAYADNLVKRGDWTRVLSEFWADGPRSSRPPGHWNEIANVVSDHPSNVQRFGGRGPLLGNLEWDLKLYLMLNGAMHDNAIATWEVKRAYGASRPITLIREMATRGQSSSPTLPSYHVNGLPLESGLIELVTPASSAPGQRHAHLAAGIGKIAIRAWAGHPAQPATQAGGSAWILGESWIPYQPRTFVTPPFPGYTSGHSGFSRAAAEVLTAMTGSPYFPGGLGEAAAATGGQGFALNFEFGPSAPLRLQWATYFDAADEAGISRIYGGIHPAFDDFPGRVIGRSVGLTAITRARSLFGVGTAALPVPGPDALALLALLVMIGASAAFALRRELG